MVGGTGAAACGGVADGAGQRQGGFLPSHSVAKFRSAPDRRQGTHNGRLSVHLVGQGVSRAIYGSGTIILPFEKLQSIQAASEKKTDLPAAAVGLKSGKNLDLAVERSGNSYAETRFGNYEIFFKDVSRIEFKEASPQSPVFPGEMTERLKVHAWKACVCESAPGVRIPLSPLTNPMRTRSSPWTYLSSPLISNT